jgi:sugar phosphate isomerase/epimerase
MNARLFPSNWRPARSEIAFARQSGFRTIQFHGQEHGIGADYLGEPPEAIGQVLRQAGITPVMEIIVRLDTHGRSPAGQTPLEVLQTNLPAIEALGCTCVHWHLAPAQHMQAQQLRWLEQSVAPQLGEAAAIGARQGFRFGVEHNEPDIPLFADPVIIERTLSSVPGLRFVWDLNHTTPDQLPGYLALAARMSMLHVSDTPLPEVNYHLPLGLGTVDTAGYMAALLAGGFRGPAILEIGGLPKSGGYGRDTDAALRDSLARLERAIAEAQGHSPAP